jgi:hypothetical protein
LKKGESVTIRCLHDNSLANATDVKMKSGELLYIICQNR